MANLCLPLFCLFCFMCSCSHYGLTLRIVGFPAFASLGPLAYGAYLSQALWLALADACVELRSLHAPVFILLGCWLQAAAIHYLVEEPSHRGSSGYRLGADVCCGTNQKQTAEGLFEYAALRSRTLVEK